MEAVEAKVDGGDASNAVPNGEVKEKVIDFCKT